MIYQDLSSVLYSLIRLVIGNCYKNHFVGTITSTFLTNQNAHNYEMFYQEIEFLVSKETVVLRRWERSKQKFGFIKRVDKD